MTDSDQATGLAQIAITNLELPVDDADHVHLADELEAEISLLLEDYDEHVSRYSEIDNPVTEDTTVSVDIREGDDE